MKNDTITAIATPPGRGGVGIIRVSGSLVSTIAKNILKKTLTPRFATYSQFLDAHSNIIDEGIVLFFPGPHSFTGEDVLEFQGHGGPIVLDCLLKRIVELGARLARPGEFTERAFLNDKLDLVQAEAIADLIHAQSEQAVRASLRSLQGAFSNKIKEIVNNLIKLRMFVEAAIDFAEEEINFLANQEIKTDLANIIQEVKSIRDKATQGSLLREGITIVIAGEPNVGKSSLLNRLSRKEVAIVTDIPGTTRDVLREEIILDGMPIHFIDTAGLRESADLVEQEGIKRARHEISRADMILCVMEAGQENVKYPDFVNEVPAHLPIIVVRNKIDLHDEEVDVKIDHNKIIISLSVKENRGIDCLIEQIKKSVGFTAPEEGTYIARRRHLDALAKALDFLIHGEIQLCEFQAFELLAEDLRCAQKALNEITGEFTSDDLLGKIFSNFCIGK